MASINVGPGNDLLEISKDFLIGKENPTTNPDQSIKLGYFPGEKWLSITLKNPFDADVEKILFFDSPTGLIKVYESSPATPTLTQLNSMGTSIPFLKRDIKSIFSALTVKIPARTEKTFWFAISSRHNVNSKVFLGNYNHLISKEFKKLSFLDFYAGGILCLIIYNFFLFLSTRDKTYVLYCFFSGFFMLAVLNISGYLDRLFQFSKISLNHFLLSFSSAAMMGATAFSYHYLEVKEKLVRFKIIYYAYFLIALWLFVVCFTPLEDAYPHIWGTMIDLIIILGNLTFLVNSYQLLAVSASAKFYLLSWILLIMTLLSWFGMTFGFIPRNPFSDNALHIGNLVQMLTISLALAHRINELTKAKNSAEERALQKDRYQRLVRVLSHDIANSLTIINSYSKKLVKNKLLDSATSVMAEKIFFSAENIRNILNNVREQELLPSRKNNFDLTPINIHEAIRVSVTIFEEQIRYKNISLTIDIPSEAIILGNNASFINNIANNIISNSIKFSNEASRIEISCSQNDQEVVIIFKDFGRGIKTELIDEIFFSTKTISSLGTVAETGHGFGANLMREYVELFNGKIIVDSKHQSLYPTDSGTCITLCFPKPN